MSKNKFYAYVVPVKKLKGVAANWAECERVVSGQVGARYKGFATEKEAKEWLRLGARYEIKTVKKPARGIYFDAGTGRGEGVEISVTDEKGRNLLHETLSKKYLNKFGKHLVGRAAPKGRASPHSLFIKDREVGWEATNNYGELLACKYALTIAEKKKIKKVFGDSRLVIDYWSRWRIKKGVAEETFALAREVAAMRKKFEEGGGKVLRVPGDNNPADLGFH